MTSASLPKRSMLRSVALKPAVVVQMVPSLLEFDVPLLDRAMFVLFAASTAQIAKKGVSVDVGANV